MEQVVSCSDCHCSQTPQWRYSKVDGRRLCNACGTFESRGNSNTSTTPRVRTMKPIRKHTSTMKTIRLCKATARSALDGSIIRCMHKKSLENTASHLKSFSNDMLMDASTATVRPRVLIEEIIIAVTIKRVTVQIQSEHVFDATQ